MTKALLRHLGMDTVGEQLSGVGVPDVVKAHAWKVLYTILQKRELMSDATWLQRFAIGAAASERLAALPNTQFEQFLSLLAFEPSKLFNCKRWQRDSAVPAGVCIFKPKVGFGLFHA